MAKLPLYLKEFIGTFVFAFAVFNTKSPYIFAVALVVMSLLLPGATFNPVITISSAYMSSGPKTRALISTATQIFAGIVAFMANKYAM